MAGQWNDASGSGGSAASPLTATSAPDAYPVSLQIHYPEPGELNRWLFFVKWLLIIQHTFVLFFLSIGMLFAIFCAWWAILFTGRYPRVLFDLVVGVSSGPCGRTPTPRCWSRTSPRRSHWVAR